MTAVLALLAIACTTSGDADTAGDGGSATGDGGGSSTTAPWELDLDEDCNLLGTADDCLLPYPSMQFMVEDPDSPTGRRVALDNEHFSSPDGELPIDLGFVDFADGFSPVTPILVNLGRDVHDSFLSGWGQAEATVQPGGPIALMHAETGQLVPLLTEMDLNNREYDGYEDRYALILRPQAAMEMGERYLVVLSRELTDTDGQAFDSPDAFVALRDGIPTTSDAVEALRDRYEDLFTTAQAAGWAREDLLLAWEFQVASEQQVLGPVRSARDQALAAIAAGDLSWTIDEIQLSPNDNLHMLVKGTFTPPSFLTEDNVLELDGAGGVVLQEGRPSYPFTLALPPQAAEGGSLPLVVLGHGLFGTGEGMVAGGSAELYTQPIAAEQGVVIVATDWIGLSGGDLDLIVSEVLPDLGRIRIVTDRLVQSHVNTIVLVEALVDGIGQDPALGLGEEPLIDGERIYYYGNSLGGIQGTGQVGISPRISRAVVAVPGGGWSHMIQRSTQFQPLELITDALYPDPLSQQVFIALMQTFFDFSDPVNLGLLLHGDDTQPETPDKVLVIQQAIGDCQVPNLATDLLARTIGAAHLEEATDPVYGLPFIDGPTTALSLTQVRVPEALDAYFPPDENNLPELDNGVHNSAVLQEAAFDQVKWLVETGEIVHPCDGVCDPQ